MKKIYCNPLNEWQTISDDDYKEMVRLKEYYSRWYDFEKKLDAGTTY